MQDSQKFLEKHYPLIKKIFSAYCRQKKVHLNSSAQSLLFKQLIQNIYSDWATKNEELEMSVPSVAVLIEVIRLHCQTLFEDNHTVDMALLQTQPSELVVKYQAMIAHIVQKQAAQSGPWSIDTQEELISQIRENLLRKIARGKLTTQFKGEASFHNYLYRVIYHSMIDVLRKRKKNKYFEEQQKKATALFYEMASKEHLLDYIEDYKYVLLSTHGFSDTENAALSGLNLYINDERERTDSFNEKGKLYLSEVMSLQLKADLVVLSSCESGVGKLQQGEGMMALHRAFLYAGASNIIYSLFKVPQDSTSELVQAFFQYVLEGDSYSTALRRAKLKLIEDESIEPIDWAGFALIGI